MSSAPLSSYAMLAQEALAQLALDQEASASAWLAQEALAQEALDQEALAQLALDQDALAHEALAQLAFDQEALAHEASARAVLAQLAASNERAELSVGSGTRNLLSARFGFGGVVSWAAPCANTVPTPIEYWAALGFAFAPYMRAPLT
jgi:hypothetical protein